MTILAYFHRISDQHDTACNQTIAVVSAWGRRSLGFLPYANMVAVENTSTISVFMYDCSGMADQVWWSVCNRLATTLDGFTLYPTGAPDSS